MKINLLSSLPKVTRSISARKKNKSKKIIMESKKFERNYFDGPRKFGYGGYVYDGRWKSVAKRIVKEYNLKKGSKVLDVGCGKGFLVKDLLDLGIDAYGLDISEYAIKNCENAVIGRIHLGNAKKLPFKKNSFDFVISINCIHNLNRNNCIIALKEISRVSKSKKSFVQVDSYDTKEEKSIFLNWVLTAVTHYYPNGWLKLFKEARYKGDWFWTKV
jgi:ubiquinone/menaquinone biosynthesis C-methylase UbiE